MRQSSGLAGEPRAASRAISSIAVRISIEVGEVLENVFSVPDDFGSRDRLDRPIVDAVGQLAQPVGAAADRRSQHGGIGGADVDEPLDAALAQPRRGHRADAPQRVDRQPLEELLDAFGRDDGQAVGLLPRGRDLREELVRRDAGRRRQPGRLANLALSAARPPCRAVRPTRSR